VEAFAGMMGLVWLVGIVMVILIPFSVYSAQKWAHKCYTELQKITKKIDDISMEIQDSRR
jgi:hypothetical protein